MKKVSPKICMSDLRSSSTILNLYRKDTWEALKTPLIPDLKLPFADSSTSLTVSSA